MKNFRSALLAAALSLVVAAGSATAAQATTKIRVGASPTPHAEILKVANDVLKPQGYELQIIEYSDYVQPNMALEGKELDANFFQHKPYLDDFNKEKGTKLVSIGTVHYEPFGIYAGKTKSLDALRTALWWPCPTTPPTKPAPCCSSSPTAHQAEGRRRPHRHPPRHRGKPQEAQDRRNRSGSARPRPA